MSDGKPLFGHADLEELGELEEFEELGEPAPEIARTELFPGPRYLVELGF